MGILNEIEDVVEGMMLNEVSNEEIIRKFVTNDFAHSKDDAADHGVRPDVFSPIYGSANLKITRQPLDMNQEVKGWILNNAAMPVLFMDNDGGIYFNSEKKNQTSITKVQNIIKNIIETDPDLKQKVREVNTETIHKLIKGEKVEQDLLKKLDNEIPEPENEEPTEETPKEVSEEIPSEETPKETEEVPE